MTTIISNGKIVIDCLLLTKLKKRNVGQIRRLKISTSGLHCLESRDLYALGLADGETEGQEKKKQLA